MTEPLNLFATFHGADLDRLVSCINKVRAEVLTLDKYAQAGINQSSGNAYIYSEYWAGCVYCSIGFNVSWSYSCPECGEEYDFNTEQECREYSEKHDGQCEECTK
jgi:predicted RNA-binding Zn-ribbon protein involved in translation (DUF1610 family)